MYAGALIGYFGKQDEARKAYSQLRRKGHRRAAWVSKSADEEIHICDPFNGRQATGVVFAFVLLGALTSIVFMRLGWPASTAWGVPSIPVLVGGLIGSLLCLATIRRSTVRVKRGIIEDHARWFVSGESVLILQAPIETLQVPMAVLFESGEVQPAVFVEMDGQELKDRAIPLVRVSIKHRIVVHMGGSKPGMPQRNPHSRIDPRISEEVHE